MKEPGKSCCSKVHLCDLMARKEDFKAVKEAAKDARFICTACGRSAKEADRLCEAEKL